MNDELRYPWQSPVSEVLVELSPSQLPQEIAVTAAAITESLRKFECATDLRERIAFDDAHRSLTALKAIQD